jgi:hypothetical protein
MTIAQIQERIQDIKATAGDDEMAHSLEDVLREDFIRYVSTYEDESLAVAARLVLSTSEMDFHRWCA